MLRHPHPRLLAAAALAAVALSGSTVAAAAPPTPVTGTKPMLNEVVHRETVICSTERYRETENGDTETKNGYTGIADIEMTMSDTTFTVTVLRYIIALPGVNTYAGDKANINLQADRRPLGSPLAFANSKAESPDAMKQDGQKHDLFLSTHVPRGTRTTDSYGGSVQFVFDAGWRWSPFPDPSCTSDRLVFPRS